MTSPDKTDVEMMMRAIEGVHGGQVRLVVSPAGIGPGGGLGVVLEHSLPGVPGTDQPEATLIVNRWPCPMHRDWWPCIFEGLYRLEAAIGRKYGQSKLPEG